MTGYNTQNLQSGTLTGNVSMRLKWDGGEPRGPMPSILLRTSMTAYGYGACYASSGVGDGVSGTNSAVQGGKKLFQLTSDADVVTVRIFGSVEGRSGASGGAIQGVFEASPDPRSARIRVLELPEEYWVKNSTTDLIAPFRWQDATWLGPKTREKWYSYTAPKSEDPKRWNGAGLEESRTVGMPQGYVKIERDWPTDLWVYTNLLTLTLRPQFTIVPTTEYTMSSDPGETYTGLVPNGAGNTPQDVVVRDLPGPLVDLHTEDWKPIGLDYEANKAPNVSGDLEVTWPDGASADAQLALRMVDRFGDRKWQAFVNMSDGEPQYYRFDGVSAPDDPQWPTVGSAMRSRTVTRDDSWAAFQAASTSVVMIGTATTLVDPLAGTALILLGVGMTLALPNGNSLTTELAPQLSGLDDFTYELRSQSVEWRNYRDDEIRAIKAQGVTPELLNNMTWRAKYIPFKTGSLLTAEVWDLGGYRGASPYLDLKAGDPADAPAKGFEFRVVKRQ